MLVRLICWNEELARERLRALGTSGFEIDGSPLRPSGCITHIKKLAPAAVLIDLDRLPSHGHAVASALRRSSSTRSIPIVFAGGAPEKVERIRAELPDAVYTTWKAAPAALRKAIAKPPILPVKPPDYMERWKNPLATKLGLKPGLQVAVVAPPDNFEDLIGEWPEGAAIQPKFVRTTELAIWFVRSARELCSVAGYLGAVIKPGVSAWICYPKQAGRYKVDFNANDVRAACLEEGLVDYKICSVDSDWSGMKFTRKKA